MRQSLLAPWHELGSGHPGRQHPPLPPKLYLHHCCHDAALHKTREKWHPASAPEPSRAVGTVGRAGQVWRHRCLGLASLKHLLSAFHAGLLLDVLPPVTNITEILLLREGWLHWCERCQGKDPPGPAPTPVHPWKPSCQLEEPSSTHAIHLFQLHPPVSTSWAPEKEILSKKKNIMEKESFSTLSVIQGGVSPEGWRQLLLGKQGRGKDTFSVSSFFTCFRLARRSMQTLCLEPSRARSMASADMRTLRSGGRLNLPRRSKSFWLRSSSWGGEMERDGFHEMDTSSAGRHEEWAGDSPEGWLQGKLTSLLVFCSFTSVSYLSSSTESILA